MTETGYSFITGKSGVMLQFIFNRLASHSHTQHLKCAAAVGEDVDAVRAHFQDLCLHGKGNAVLTKLAF